MRIDRYIRINKAGHRYIVSKDYIECMSINQLRKDIKSGVKYYACKWDGLNLICVGYINEEGIYVAFDS